MITLYENLRTIVYAPFYLADRRGFWSEEGLEVAIRLSPNPVETAEGLMAGRADISWGGPMRVMLHHDRDPNCQLVAFDFRIQYRLNNTLSFFQCRFSW